MHFSFRWRLRLEGDASGYSGYACRVEPDDGYVQFPLSALKPPDDCAESGADFPLDFPVLDAGSTQILRVM